MADQGSRSVRRVHAGQGSCHTDNGNQGKSSMISKRPIYIAVALLSGLVAWLAGRLLVGAIYNGNAGEFLNAFITGQASHSLEEYLAHFNTLFVIIIAVAIALLLLRRVLTPGVRRALIRGLPFIIGIASVAFIALIYGAWLAWSDSGLYKLWLEETFDATHAVYEDLFRHRPLYGEADTWVLKSKRKLQGLGTYSPEDAQDGVTLVYGMQSAWLVDMDGTILHSWSVDYDSIKTDKELIPRSYPVTYIYWHMARLLPNGDLVVMIDQYDKNPNGLAMMKIDRDSNVLWIHPHHVHHDFNFDEQGNIYAIDQRITDDKVKGLKLETPYLDDGLVVLTPDGEQIDRISLLEAFSGSDLAGFFNNYSSYRHGDYLHTNNVDILKPGLFGAASGGVLLSFNALGAIAVMDRESRKIVWARAGFWKHQHDPDLLANNNILLFNNLCDWRMDNDACVIEIDPQTYEIVWQYPDDPDTSLHSTYRGRQQALANGNVLISEFQNGRLLEVTRDGRTVWEYSCPFVAKDNPDYVCNFVGGRRYDRSSLNFEFNGKSPM
jgi:hypothetical protein